MWWCPEIYRINDTYKRRIRDLTYGVREYEIKRFCLRWTVNKNTKNRFTEYFVCAEQQTGIQRMDLLNILFALNSKQEYKE